MKYVCIDRGGAHCPCQLMEAGQCYTCTMCSAGRCDCDEAAGWQGVCPYTEYLQQGAQLQPQEEAVIGRILDRTVYSEELTVMRLAVPRGFAERCLQLGSCVLAEACGYQTPLSVLRAETAVDRINEGDLFFAMQRLGPKTQALLQEDCTHWRLSGPFYNGLACSEAFDEKKTSVVIARGTAVAPLICMKHRLLQADTEIYLDDEKLPTAFVQRYLGDVTYQQVRLREAETLQDLQARLQEIEKAAVQTDGGRRAMPNLFLLTSPYYVEQLTAGLIAAEQAIVPNPANFCCCVGVCGACSHTDADGITVRRCKCNHPV